ncbi:MAG: hypothetical protein SGILL_004118 [Bacillariaceae sp.]
MLESSEHTNSSNQHDNPTATGPATITPVKTESPQSTKESVVPPTTTTTAAIPDTSDPEELKAIIAKLQSDLAKAQQTIQENEMAHQEKEKQLDAKANQGFQGMERAKEKIGHLEQLAVEAVNGLKAVQEQASAEIELLRKKLAVVEAERDDLLAKSAAK